MHELVKVKQDQLPDLLTFVEKHLPESWVMYCKLRASIEGKWDGNTYVALIDTQWPNILAVGEGEVDEEKCTCAKFFAEPRTVAFFAPDKETTKELVLWPGYLDLNKLMILQGLPDLCLEAFMELSGENPGGQSFPSIACEVKQEDLVRRPIPAGMTTGVLTPEMADYVASTWPYNRPYAATYIAECIKNFPSVTLLDSDGSMVGFELVKEMGDMGFLYVEEKYRHKGYAKIIASCLAQKCYEEGRRAICFIVKDNQPSLRLHEAVGFKPLCDLTWYYHPGGEGWSWKKLKKLKETSQGNVVSPYQSNE